MNQPATEPTTTVSRGVFQSPLVIGIVAITIMTGAIIAFGSNLLPQNALDGISQGQIEDLDRFSSVIHLGDAEITGPGAREHLGSVVSTNSFDALMKRGLFGANAQRLDLYTITGEPLYATSGTDQHLKARCSPPSTTLETTGPPRSTWSRMPPYNDSVSKPIFSKHTS